MVSHRDCSSVPPINSSLSSRPTSTCPFCHLSFVRLGCHLPKCKQRGDRDYSAYLSDKTRRKARMLNRQCCPICLRSFRRLDTHFRVSATCKSILPETSQSLGLGVIRQVPLLLTNPIHCIRQTRLILSQTRHWLGQALSWPCP